MINCTCDTFNYCCFTADTHQPWVDLSDYYSEYLIIHFDYFIFLFDYFDYRVKYSNFLLAVGTLFDTIFVISKQSSGHCQNSNVNIEYLNIQNE